MAVRLVVTMTAAKGKGDEFLKLFTAHAQNAVHKEPGCEQYEVFRSPADPDRFALLERWKDRKSLEGHQAAARARPAPYASLRGAPSAIEQFDVP